MPAGEVRLVFSNVPDSLGRSANTAKSFHPLRWVMLTETVESSVALVVWNIVAKSCPIGDLVELLEVVEEDVEGDDVFNGGKWEVAAKDGGHGRGRAGGCLAGDEVASEQGREGQGVEDKEGDFGLRLEFFIFFSMWSSWVVTWTNLGISSKS